MISIVQGTRQHMRCAVVDLMLDHGVRACSCVSSVLVCGHRQGVDPPSWCDRSRRANEMCVLIGSCWGLSFGLCALGLGLGLGLG